MLGADQLVSLELPVNGAAGVDVDAREVRQLTHARQPIALAQCSASDHRPQLPAEEGADGNGTVALDLEVDQRRPGKLLVPQRHLNHRRLVHS
jgi:hypothetical protein